MIDAKLSLFLIICESSQNFQFLMLSSALGRKRYRNHRKTWPARLAFPHHSKLASYHFVHSILYGLKFSGSCTSLKIRSSYFMKVWLFFQKRMDLKCSFWQNGRALLDVKFIKKRFLLQKFFISIFK